jgi:hypothetical protein
MNKSKQKKMDIRDIKDEVRYPGPTTLSELFVLQKVLLESYIKIEGMPRYPIDINTKESQKLLKDFSGRIIEEFGEGFESYLTMMDMFHRGDDESLMVPFLQNFNEEIADAIHFWLELMVYSGYEVTKMNQWLTHYTGNDYSKADGLKTYFYLGQTLVNADMQGLKLACRMVIEDKDLNDEFLVGGRKLSNRHKDLMKIYLWDITYWLQMARNTLKNKPWKQSQMLTDGNIYELALREATVALFKFCAFVELTPESFFLIYYKKNKVNQFRIASKY